jgi:hypothetical protein
MISPFTFTFISVGELYVVVSLSDVLTTTSPLLSILIVSPVGVVIDILLSASTSTIVPFVRVIVLSCVSDFFMILTVPSS